MRSSTERYLLNYASASRNSPPWRVVQLHGVALWGGAQQVVDRLPRSREGTLAERDDAKGDVFQFAHVQQVPEPGADGRGAAVPHVQRSLVGHRRTGRWVLTVENPLAFDAVGYAVFDLVLPQGRHCLAEERTGVIRGLQDRRDVDDQRHAQGCRVVLQFGEVAEACRWMLAVLLPDAVGMARSIRGAGVALPARSQGCRSTPAPGEGGPSGTVCPDAGSGSCSGSRWAAVPHCPLLLK